QLQQRRRICRNFHFDMKMLGRFRQLHLKKQIVHVGYNARHEVPLLDCTCTSMPNGLGCEKWAERQPREATGLKHGQLSGLTSRWECFAATRTTEEPPRQDQKNVGALLHGARMIRSLVT